MRKVVVEPRMLKKEEAASYCGMTVAAFEMHCLVRPAALDQSTSSRYVRWDIKLLDIWLDQIGPDSAYPEADDLWPPSGRLNFETPTTIVQPRMLTRKRAAAYCGIGVRMFESVCPVSPSEGHIFCSRHRRWDRKLLDLWLDSKASPSSEENRGDEYWLAKLEREL